MTEANPGKPAAEVPAEPAPDMARRTATARARWLDPGWRATALAWAEAALVEVGRRVTGPPHQPHVRPWSTALSIPTDAGLAWFKAGGPGNGYEAALLDHLARWKTPGVLLPIAVNVERDWLLELFEPAAM